MPEHIEAAFVAAGTSLFPATGHDLVTNCSCPDWSNPCKHIAAVHYLLGEIYTAEHDEGRARAEYEKALRLLPPRSATR